MPKQTKDQKRKAKLEKRRKAGERQVQQQTEMLIRMLTELCAPLLQEYTDDSKGPDLTGRMILYCTIHRDCFNFLNAEFKA